MSSATRTELAALKSAAADNNPWRTALQESAYACGYLKGSMETAIIQLTHGLHTDAAKTLRDALTKCDARRAA